MAAAGLRHIMPIGIDESDPTSVFVEASLWLSMAKSNSLIKVMISVYPSATDASIDEALTYIKMLYDATSRATRWIAQQRRGTGR
jgi:hypothetical protein